MYLLQAFHAFPRVSIAQILALFTAFCTRGTSNPLAREIALFSFRLTDRSRITAVRAWIASLSDTGTTSAVDERRQPPGRQPSVWIALCVAIGIALAAGLAITTVLEVSDTMPRDIFTTLAHHEAPRDLTVDGPPIGVYRGMQLALFGLLLGGVPAAILSAALVAFRRKSRKPWSGNWANVFLAGFVFQLSSLGLTTLLAVRLLWDYGAAAADVLPFGGFLGLSLLCGAAALRFWRELQDSVHDEPVRITPVQRAG